LAIAQSVCEDWHVAEDCHSTTAQPRSAILQYNRITHVFSEMLSRTDNENIRLRGTSVPDSQIGHRQYALRLDVGRAVSWEYFEIFGRRFLVASSLSHGAITYEFSFKTISSLRGSIDVTSDTHNTRVFVVNGASGAITSVYTGPSFDTTGALRSPCSPLPCLSYSKTLDAPLGEARSISWRSPSGRLGVGWVGKGAAGEWGEWGVDQLAVVGGTFRDEVHCLSLIFYSFVKQYTQPEWI